MNIVAERYQCKFLLVCFNQIIGSYTKKQYKNRNVHRGRERVDTSKIRRMSIYVYVCVRTEISGKVS